MSRALLSDRSSTLFSPMIDVILNALGAIFLLFIVYWFMVPPEDPEELHFLKTKPSPVIRSQSFVYTLPVTGGCRGERTFRIIDGALPNGLELDTQSGTVFGVPAISGSQQEFSVEFEVIDEGSCRDSVIVEFTIFPSVFPYDPQNPGFQILKKVDELPAGRVNVAYEVVLGAIGGVEPYEWHALDSLPSGLKLDKGVLRGVPTEAGVRVFRVQARHLSGSFAYGGVKKVWDGGSREASFRLAILPALEHRFISSAGRVGEPFLAVVHSSSWLPEELIEWQGLIEGVEPSRGGFVLEGIPTQAGTADLSYRILRSDSESGHGAGQVTILPAYQELRLGNVVFQTWLGERVLSLIPHDGGSEPVVIKPLNELPPGLLIRDGHLEGIPENIGLFAVQIEAEDAGGAVAKGELSIRVGTRF